MESTRLVELKVEVGVIVVRAWMAMLQSEVKRNQRIGYKIRNAITGNGNGQLTETGPGMWGKLEREFQAPDYTSANGGGGGGAEVKLVSERTRPTHTLTLAAGGEKRVSKKARNAEVEKHCKINKHFAGLLWLLVEGK